MASNSQQFSARNDVIVLRGINDATTDSSSSANRKLEGKLDTLVSLVTQLSMNQKSSSSSTSVARVCGIFTSNDHHTDSCPSLQQPSDVHAAQAYAANIYNNRLAQQQQQNFDLSSNRYKPGWRNHPNLRWGNSQQQQNQIDIPITVPPPPSATTPVPVPTSAPEQNDEPFGAQNFHAGEPSSSTNSDLQQPPIPLPFPPKLIPRKKMEEVDKDILETFRKVEVNIPLLDAIKKIPRYVKFLKELCTHKRKMKGNERISMGRNVSALIGKSVPHILEKCKDSGFIEDVLVRVGELIFPANFYVLDMEEGFSDGSEEGFSHGSAPIILCRPFLKIAQNKIDVYAGTLSMEFGDSILHFNILDAMKHPSEDHSVFRAEIHDDVVDEYASDFYSLHDKKHCFLSDLYNSLACTESASEFDFESVSVSDFDSCSKNKSDFVSDVLGA
ncbi:uncharacterized protein LOC109793846, partial [Cajanus cajan]|uniref:uncharacterized protein LOC109793846 n=1 Tax=Cajanus cajan TaxID=3821 RepID=UPI00098D86E3